ncbi:MAG TPA: hypothetical protein VGD88_00585 [Opitutaceae bacterium]
MRRSFKTWIALPLILVVGFAAYIGSLKKMENRLQEEESGGPLEEVVRELKNYETRQSYIQALKEVVLEEYEQDALEQLVFPMLDGKNCAADVVGRKGQHYIVSARYHDGPMAAGSYWFVVKRKGVGWEYAAHFLEWVT